MTEKEDIIEKIKFQMEELEINLEDLFQTYGGGEFEIPDSFRELQKLVEEL